MGIGSDFEEETRRIIKESEGPSIVKRQVTSEIAGNPQAIIDGKDRALKERSLGKNPSVKDQFFESISFFLPSIVGGLVGSAIGGSEGAGKGAELGLRAGAQLSARQSKDADRALKARMDADNREFRINQDKLNKKVDAAELEDKQAFAREEREGRQAFTSGITSQKLSVKGEKPLSEAQSKSRLFGARSIQAENIFASLDKKAFDPTSTKHRVQKHLARELQSEEFQKFTQAKQNFLNAILRKESGARISEEEILVGDKQYFPQPGDTEAVVAQKMANRKLASSLLAEEGRVDVNDPRFKVLKEKEEEEEVKAKIGRPTIKFDTQMSIINKIKAKRNKGK